MLASANNVEYVYNLKIKTCTCVYQDTNIIIFSDNTFVDLSSKTGVSAVFSF